MFGESRLNKSSLGRLGFIGELYDIRTESMSSYSVLKTSHPSKFIRSLEVGHFDFDYKFTENISDRFDLFNVEGEIQVSILLGLVKLEGSGKFLTDNKKSGKTVCCSLKCQIETVKEKLFGSIEEILPYLDLSALENPNYTHLISEINWGANCLLSLEYACNSDSSKEDIRGRLAGEFSKIKGISVSGFANLTLSDSDLLSEKDITVKIRSDILPKAELPSTVEGFCRFVKEIPALLKEMNDGKGKPLNYSMIPLSDLQKIAKVESSMEIVVRNIGEGFVVSTVYFFEELSRIKINLQDLLAEMEKSQKYVTVKQFKQVREKISVLSSKESDMKCKISEDWVSVRSGKKDLRDLIRQMENYKNHDLNLFEYEEFLGSYSPLLGKLSTIMGYISRGIVYLGKGEKLITVQKESVFSDWIILVISSEIEKADPELAGATCQYFLKVASQKKPNFAYVVLDFDYAGEEENRKSFFNTKITTARCFHLKGLDRVVSRDLYGDFLAEMKTNFACVTNKSEMEYCRQKPGSRTVLEIICPLRCSPAPVVWNCFICKKHLEYGFDDCYYCSCGKAPANCFRYLCRDMKHEGDFVVPPDPEFVKICLSELRPTKDLNILLIGQSGVGKSTWINSIVNYLMYSSMEEAEQEGIVSTIPTSFVKYDSNAPEKQRKSEDPNEVTEAGFSATQTTHTYRFHWEGFNIRLIDTPGLGDTRGINQDKRNMANIIHQLSFLKEIHGICILLKANDPRSNTIYVYCLKELLIHLHKDVLKNIVFCFTNARSTLYSSGQAGSVLRKVMEVLPLNERFELGHHNTFIVDNEGFLFLYSTESAEKNLDETLRNSLAKSWEKSTEETIRLFNTIKTFNPHQLRDTISLETARTRILTLAKPIAEISKTVQINVTTIERKKNEIKNSQLTVEELMKKLYYTEVYLESKPLQHPRTVCTSPSCIEYITYKSVDVKEINYKTHCHDKCQLEEVTPKTTNNHLLKNCAAMTDGVCDVCRCGWENHMHLTYSQTRAERTVTDKNVQKQANEEQMNKKKVEEFVNNLESLIDKYKHEQQVIIQTSAKLGRFLKKNSIACYNDSVSDYLDYLIDKEEKKPEKSTAEKQILNNLKETLEQYKAEVLIMQNLLKVNVDEEEVTAQMVIQLEEELYNLPLTGAEIRNAATASRNAAEKLNKYLETSVEVVNAKKSSKSKKNKWFW